LIAGIDLGGTQVRVAVAHRQGPILPKRLRHRRAQTRDIDSPRAFVEWAADSIARLSGGRRVQSVAVGAPGPVDPQAGVLINPPNLEGWRNVPLARMLKAATRAPAYVQNDANLAAWGEFRHGAGRGARTLIYVTWSTGIGGGLIVDGRLLSGAHGSAGEVGHMIIDPDGPLDSCGQRGCLEALAGGHMLRSRTGRSAADLFRLAARGDGEALGVVRQAASYVGYALINLSNLIDPEVIIIGGGISRSWSLVRPLLRDTLRASPFITPARRPRLRRAALGDAAGQVGALQWARDQLTGHSP